MIEGEAKIVVGRVTHYLPPKNLKTPPLSFATEAQGLLFVSGIPGFKDDGSLGETFSDQFKHAVQNVNEVLSRAGCGIKDILKLTIFLTRATDIEEMNTLYGPAVGPAPYPARTTCVVRALPDPAMLLEIECVALLPDHTVRHPDV
jgi:2-iminobutanoate/2-iminopropanoate deaminase